MNQTSGRSTVQTGNGNSSLPYWLLIFIVVVLLPVFMCRSLAGLVVAERMDARSGILAQSLERDAGELAKLVGPRALEGFFEVGLNLDSAARRGFLENLERKAPGAFKMLMWNRFGEELAGIPAQRLDVPKGFQVVVNGLLSFSMSANFIFGTAMKAGVFDESCFIFQELLGNEVSLDAVLKCYGFPKMTKIHGRPVIVFWKTLFLRDSFASSGFSREMVQGFLMLIDPGKLPVDFFPGLLVDRQGMTDPEENENRWISRDCSLAFIDMRAPENSRLPPGQAFEKDFAGRVVAAFDTRKSGRLIIDSWLIVPVPGAISPTRALVLLKDVASIRNEERVLRSRLDAVTGGAVVLGLLIVGLLSRGWGAFFHLKWRVILLLFVANLLPLFGVAWVGARYVKEMELQAKSMSFQRMRSLSLELPRRLKAFVPWFGVAMRKRLQRDISRFSREGELLDYLRGRRQYKGSVGVSGMFSHFYLGDSQGNLAWTSFFDQGPSRSAGKEVTLAGKKHELVAYRILLRRLHQQQFGMKTKGSLLGESFVEDLEAKDKDEGGKSHFDLPFGAVSCLKFGRGVTYLLPLAIRLGTEKRVLLIHFSVGIVERFFLRFEMVRGLLAQDRTEQGAGMHHFFLSRGAETTSLSSTSLAGSLVEMVDDSFSQEAFGEFAKSERSFLYFMAPRNRLVDHRIFFFMDLEPVLALSRRRIQALFMCMLGFFLFSAWLGVVLSGRILQPVARLHQTLAAIGAGDLSVSLPPGGNDEIARLERNVNQMTRELRERDRLKAYLPESTRQAIRDEVQTTGFDARRQEVTVLFSDIRGFTTLSERHPPEVIFSLLNEYFEVVEQCIRTRQGQVQKFIGDAVFAVFPAPGSEGARRAIAAARAIMAFLAEFNQNRRERGAFPIEIGIGLHTGTVLLGKVGSENRQEFAYIGEAVTLAAELEAASKHGAHTRIILSEPVCRLMAGEIQTVALSSSAGFELLPASDGPGGVFPGN
jgi:class 3 adenylate cyclase